LSQAALETLGWTHLVKISGMSRSKFNGLKAAGAIRELLKRMGIPSGVPATLSSLQALANTCVPADAVSAIVGVRSSLVHPEKQATVAPVTEAWTLA